MLSGGGTQIRQLVMSNRNPVVDGQTAKAASAGGSAAFEGNDGPITATALVRSTVAPGTARKSVITIAGIDRTTVKTKASPTIVQGQ